MIKKPDKPNYQIPKAYRPIALISTLAKVLTALIAENISHLVELHQLLPKTHFGGRPGRTTTDAIHYLVHKIYESKFILDSFIFWVFPARFLRRLAANVDFSTRSCDFPHQYCSILDRKSVV